MENTNFYPSLPEAELCKWPNLKVGSVILLCLHVETLTQMTSHISRAERCTSRSISATSQTQKGMEDSEVLETIDVLVTRLSTR